jgi:hypothetical protein
MMRFTRKKFVALAAGALSLGLTVGAYAYFSAPGSGTGSASVGTGSAITLDASTTGLLLPGGPGRDVAITVSNPGSGAQHVNTVTLDSVATGSVDCAGTDFTMPAVSVNSTLASGDSIVKHGTLTMADNGDQNACKNASLTLNLSSN